MEVGVRVDAEDPITGQIVHCCTAYLTFVALDDDGRPRPIPELDCADDPQLVLRVKQANDRRNIRLKMRRQRKKTPDITSDGDE